MHPAGSHSSGGKTVTASCAAVAVISSAVKTPCRASVYRSPRCGSRSGFNRAIRLVRQCREPLGDVIFDRLPFKWQMRRLIRSMPTQYGKEWTGLPAAHLGGGPLGLSGRTHESNECQSSRKRNSGPGLAPRGSISWEPINGVMSLSLIWTAIDHFVGLMPSRRYFCRSLSR